MKLNLTRFLKWTNVLPPEFVADLNRNFDTLNDTYRNSFEVRTFVNASTGAVTKFLPNGRENPDKDYFFEKTDASGNTVTIQAFTGQTIIGSSTYVLAAQFAHAFLMWDQTTQQWLVR